MKLQNKLIFPILFFGCLLYFLTGLFPFTHYETDAMGVVAGCKHIIDTGVFSANYYTYSFEMQPGIYFWIILVHKIFGTNLVVTYSIISAFFGVASLFISAYFISIITKANYYLIGIVLLLFQEMYSSWYYMNSATGAAFFLILGLTVVANTSSHYTYRFLLSASLLALSAWIRFDVVIVFPAVILLIKSDNLKKKFIWACIIGVITVFLMNYLYGLSHVSLYALFSENAGGNGIQIADNLKTSGGLFSSQMMRSIIGFFSILILFLMSVGSFYLYKKK